MHACNATATRWLRRQAAAVTSEPVNAYASVWRDRSIRLHARLLKSGRVLARYNVRVRSSPSD